MPRHASREPEVVSRLKAEEVRAAELAHAKIGFCGCCFAAESRFPADAPVLENKFPSQVLQGGTLAAAFVPRDPPCAVQLLLLGREYTIGEVLDQSPGPPPRLRVLGGLHRFPECRQPPLTQRPQS